MKKVFGIPSWLPDKEPARSQRQERINRLFKQLNDLWPDIDILVIAQNWQDFKPIETRNKQIVKQYDPLGILKARQVLRAEFLKLDYDYIIMFDDDAIIKFTDKTCVKNYMQILDKHPTGFCFVPGSGSDGYAQAQLNLCAISRYIYEKEPIPNIDPQNNEGYEDQIYAHLLHIKYARFEFKFPDGLKCIQFQNKSEAAPSTWAGEVHSKGWRMLQAGTKKVSQYINDYKDMPRDEELKKIFTEVREKFTRPKIENKGYVGMGWFNF